MNNLKAEINEMSQIMQEYNLDGMAHDIFADGYEEALTGVQKKLGVKKVELKKRIMKNKTHNGICRCTSCRVTVTTMEIIDDVLG